MKRIVLICLIAFLHLFVKAQTDSFPAKTPQGSNKTLIDNLGGLRGGLINKLIYADTTTANTLAYFKYYEGAQLVTYTDSIQFWIRYNNKWNKISGGGGGGTSATDSAAVLRNITDIATLARTDINTISVIDTLRGGTFFRYTGSDAVDNGMIFADANGTKWLRQTYGIDFINVNWYGAYAYTNYTDDMSPYFNAALSYIKKHQGTYRKLYCPANYNTPSDNSWYLLKNTVSLKDVTLIGDGTEKAPYTLFQIWYHITAFSLPALNDYGSPNSVNVSNVKVRHYYDYVAGDSSSHSFDIHCFVNFENVYVMENSQGNAFNIVACAGVATSDPTYGNADQSYFRGCKANLSINGFWIEGCDANVINFINCDASVNKRWGVYDGGMLGNRFYNFHWAGNGNQDNTGCIYGGKYYYPVDGLDNTGKSPLLHPSYWYEIGPIGYVTAWDTAKRYWSGGTAIVSNVNAWTMFHGCYIESSQPPLILNGRSVFVEGTPGSTIYGGIWERTLNGTKIYTGANYGYKPGLQMDRLSVNQAPDGNYQASVTGETYQVMQLISPSNLTTLSFQNLAALGQGGMAYYNDQLLLTAGGSYRIQLDNTGLYPWTNNAITLGRPSYRYSGVYSFLPSGVGDKAVRYNSATGQFTYADTSIATSVNIYNSDGSLTGNRYMDGAGYEMGMSGFSLFDINTFSAPTVSSVNMTGVHSQIAASRGGLDSYVRSYADSVELSPSSGNMFVKNLTLGYGNKSLRWNSSTNKVTYVDTVADFSLTNGSHFLPDSLLIPISANALKVRSLQAGTNVTLTATDSSIIINASGGGGAGMAIGGTITSATAGSVLYAGTNGFLQQSNSYLYYDSTNRRFYVGTNSGTGTLNLRAASGNTDFKLTDGSGTETWGAAATTAGDFAFFHSGATPFKIARFATDNALYINASGKTGFNTASPDSTVTINGGLRINNGAAVSGYVWTATGTDGRGTWQAATGGGLSSSNFVFNEVPSGTINGVNTTFTLANTPTAGTVAIFLRGLRMKLTTDYTISGSTITMINIPDTGDDLVVDYLK